MPKPYVRHVMWTGSVVDQWGRHHPALCEQVWTEEAKSQIEKTYYARNHYASEEEALVRAQKTYVTMRGFCFSYFCEDVDGIVEKINVRRYI